MELGEAVRTAKAFVANVYRDEAVARIGLEEIFRDDASGDWLVTVGFDRLDAEEDDRPFRLLPPRRRFKVVRIHDGVPIAIKDRTLEIAS